MIIKTALTLGVLICVFAAYVLSGGDEPGGFGGDPATSD